MITSEIIPVENNQVISLDIAKKHLKIESDYDEDDSLIELQISAAQKVAENYMQRAVGRQNLVMTMSVFQSVIFEGSSNDLVGKVEYYAPDSDVLTELDPAEYSLKKSGLINFEISFKTTPQVDDRDDAVVITINQGYAADDCPADIKAAMLLMIGDMYERREDREQGSNPASVNLMRPYRKW